MRSRVWVNQASGSTLFIFAVCSSVAMVAQLLPLPLLPAKREFFLVMAWAGLLDCSFGKRQAEAVQAA